MNTSLNTALNTTESTSIIDICNPKLKQFYDTDEYLILPGAKFKKGILDFYFDQYYDNLVIGLGFNTQNGRLGNFKIKDDVFIVEAKHVKGEGGAQNSSLSELISMLELRENKPNIHYIAFLDGSYTKYLAVSEPKKDGNKLEKQKYRIIETLQKNKDNYFLNTAGFERFVDDLK